MARGETNRDSDDRSTGQARPYAPGWTNLLAGFVGRRPGSFWLYYLGLGAVLLLAQVIALWLEGALATGGLALAHGYMSVVIAYMLALMHLLDERAGAALANMRPALETGDEEYRTIHYRLTTLPALPTLLASLATLAFVIVSETIGEPYRLETLATFPVSANLLRLIYFVGWLVLGAFLYHTFHQLRLIDHIYTRHTRIEIFRVRNLYAFSNLAALTAGSLAMISYGWLLANPGIDRNDPIVLIPMVVLLLFAAVTFVWPQLGLHRLQVTEKERMLEEGARRLEATIGELHRRIDTGEIEGMGELNTALSSLQLELNILRKSPTWPWEPEVVRVLITALVLPLGLWFIQLILQRILAP